MVSLATKIQEILHFVTSSCQGLVTVEVSGRWEDEEDVSFLVSHERLGLLPSRQIWDWWKVSGLESSVARSWFLFVDAELECFPVISAWPWWTIFGILKLERLAASTDQTGCLRDSDVAALCGADLTGASFFIAGEMPFVFEVVSWGKKDTEAVSTSLRSFLGDKSFNSFPFSCSSSPPEMDLVLAGAVGFALPFFSFLESFLALPNIFCILCSRSLNSGLFTLDDVLWWDFSSQLRWELACVFWETSLLRRNDFEDPVSTVLVQLTTYLSLTVWE